MRSRTKKFNYYVDVVEMENKNDHEEKKLKKKSFEQTRINKDLSKNQSLKQSGDKNEKGQQKQGRNFPNQIKKQVIVKKDEILVNNQRKQPQISIKKVQINEELPKQPNQQNKISNQDNKQSKAGNKQIYQQKIQDTLLISLSKSSTNKKQEGSPDQQNNQQNKISNQDNKQSKAGNKQIYQQKIQDTLLISLSKSSTNKKQEGSPDQQNNQQNKISNQDNKQSKAGNKQIYQQKIQDTLLISLSKSSTNKKQEGSPDQQNNQQNKISNQDNKQSKAGNKQIYQQKIHQINKESFLRYFSSDPQSSIKKKQQESPDQQNNQQNKIPNQDNKLSIELQMQLLTQKKIKTQNNIQHLPNEHTDLVFNTHLKSILSQNEDPNKLLQQKILQLQINQSIISQLRRKVNQIQARAKLAEQRATLAQQRALRAEERVNLAEENYLTLYSIVFSKQKSRKEKLEEIRKMH